MQNKAILVLALALLLITLYQQNQIKQLRNDFKTLNSQNLQLLDQVRTLEASQEQGQATLEQLNARLGYVDSKVAKVMDKHATVTSQSPEESKPESPSIDDDTESPERRPGLLDSLQQIFH